MHDRQTSLLPLLKRYFGFDGFRPLQEAIIEDSLAGRDVFALLPTGGGKSLCYQLPALARPGLTVVVSPLIALMKDQVDALHASGIAATYLNSSLSPAESQERLRGLREDRFRLLYLAPERLMVAGFFGGPRAPAGRSHRDRRGPLHQRMGTRFPARVPPAHRVARSLPGRAGHGAHGDRYRCACARTSWRTSGSATRAAIVAQLQPPEPPVSGGGQVPRLPPDAAHFFGRASETTAGSSTV